MAIRCLYGAPSEISPGHWQSGFPVDGDKLHRAGFDVLVLAANELQPSRPGSIEHKVACAVAEEVVDFDFPGVEIITAPLDDSDGPTPEEAAIATAGAERVLDALSRNKRVLVSCQAGRNRSGLISALVLAGRYGLSGKAAAQIVRLRRKGALTNESFSKFLSSIPAPPRVISQR
jgi:hypothetical protein